ncbi:MULTISPECIES: DUF1796 family putative cysteine peptidase [unclassified Paenibacillus]|uniref:DUF1796 family putative cysteine peptidase n=1 Tax=unclassified Paenibacillus TaxID=185978 RepID=UPI001C114CE5|nr:MULTISPECIES: DUF1796 family putative cysteine peptidase [unclassified Paenibacillus]MBU5440822.1 papain-like cysteine peptidase [Paenibacillus sp. MSJ-34]CAH0118482.1 hypothetical protein PAE9249_00971 [Paenibacillus sp. CECT 9249]
MKLAEIKGVYHSIFSLGFNCTPAIQLEANKLRPFAGVLDWTVSAYLSDVNRLLKNRFAGFMELPNLKMLDFIPNHPNYVVQDTYYNMVSSHDFPIRAGSDSYLSSYPEFKEKLNRRVARTLEKMASDPKLLFVRLNGTFEEASELQSVLASMVTHDFRVLLVNYTQVPYIVDLEWPLEKVCSVELPAFDMYASNYDPNWNILLEGIQYVNA